jgi:sulfofructosephosphate aldolase
VRLQGTKTAVLELLAMQCTAVLIDARMATSEIQWQPPQGVGLIVGLDEYDYDDVTFPPPNIPSREFLREVYRTGASAAKIVLYVDPRTSDATARCEVVAEIADHCHEEGLPLLVEPLPIPVTNGSEDGPWPVVDVAAQVSRTGADILKLPFPSGLAPANLATEITRAAGGTPWILLSSGVPYEEFIATLRAAMDGGAVGFAAGRSIWKDLVVDVTDERARREAVKRLEGAARLTRPSGRADFYESKG